MLAVLDRPKLTPPATATRPVKRVKATMEELHLDWETYSEADLKKVGVHKYAKHKSTLILCAAWSFGDEEPQLWLPGMPCPPRIVAHVLAGGEVHAWNAQFERLLWLYVAGPQHGWPLPDLEQYRCVMVRALAMNLPGALENAAPALGLPIRKDDTGKRVMLQLCKPRPSFLKKGFVVRWTPETAPEKFAILYEYCLQDVRVEVGCGKRVVKLKDSEQKLWFIDQQINDRGVFIDIPLVEAMSRIVVDTLDILNKEMRDVTQGAVTSVNAVSALKVLLHDFGFQVESCDKETLTKLLIRDDIPEHVYRAIEIRLEAGKASTTKIKAFLDRLCDDGTVKGTLQFCGAGQTGRWAARGLQVQNFPRPTPGVDTVSMLIDIMTGDHIIVRAMWGSPMQAVADCLRGCIAARPGNTLRSVDLTGIEARVNPWLAGAEDVLQAFRDFDTIIGLDKKGKPIRLGPDAYCVAAAQIYNVDVSEIDNKDPRRQVGKVAVLALGFGGGAGAFASMAKIYKVDLEAIYFSVITFCGDAMLKMAEDAWKERGSKSGMRKFAWIGSEIVKLLWRAANPDVVQFWKDLENAAVLAIQNPGRTFEAGEHIKYRKSGSFLRCILPSGRSIWYPYAEVEWKPTPWGTNKATLFYKAVDGKTNKWKRHHLYGGKQGENVTQSAARDVCAEGIVRHHDAGYQPIMSVHDENVADDPVGFGSDEEFLDLMVKPPSWTGGTLPIAATGWNDFRYKKD
jgi:DNA polymerase